MIELQDKLKLSLGPYVPHLLGVFIMVLLVHDVFGKHGFLAMREKQREIQKVSKELGRLEKENAELQQNVQDLKSDPETIRRIGREEMGLAGQGEVIIKMPAPRPDTPLVVKP